jgi:hypothetical protein
MNPGHAIRLILAGRPRSAPSRRRFAASVILLLGSFTAGAVFAQELSREQMKGLDEQVQEIKSDVLGIAAELNTLEERLLYPSNTQVAVFVALAEEEDIRLDAVEISINGEPVAHHIYSFKELEALQGGGVQRIYTGNIPTGSHQIEVSVLGKLPSGKEVAETASFGFDKDVEPALVGVTLAGVSAGNSGIKVGEW